jgi:dTDP-4-amino-4,6-dideoxygalactose transaminase
MIPFNRPALVGREQAYMAEALASGKLSGDGPFCRRAEKLLEQSTGTKRALLTTSCTHALEMSAFLLDLAPGDEVIVPAFTFVSTVNAFAIRGAKAVFADIRPDTLNLDETKLEALVTPRTRAVVPVHYAGVGCEMDAILEIARRRKLVVVEDNAHGLFGAYRGQPLGTFGELATQSFHDTKNFTCGEGGALLVNASAGDAFAARAEILREKGTNRSQFFRGQVDKYTWVDIGSSYILSDLLGAMLLGQLEERVSIQQRRRAVWERYRNELASWAAASDVTLPTVPAHCEQAFHMFYLLLPTLERRTAFIEHLKQRGAAAVFHYLPLHLSPMGVRLGGKVGDCPVTEAISDRLVRLPFYTELTAEDQGRVIEAVQAFRC